MMTKGNNNRFVKRGYLDVSAFLAIAFVFQLIWPIIAFAAQDLPDEYEIALRNNICQVMLEAESQNSSPQESTLGDIFCDWCVASCSPQSHGVTVSNEISLSFDAPLTVSFKVEERHIVYELQRYVTAPRAPPFL